MAIPLPELNRLAHYNGIFLFIVSLAVNLHQRFIREKKGFWETISRWLAIWTFVIVVVTWFIRQGTGV